MSKLDLLNLPRCLDVVALRPGDKLKCMFIEAGYKRDEELAKKHLKLDEIYTISKIDVYDWHTDIWLEEIPGVMFNSVHFVEVNDAP